MSNNKKIPMRKCVGCQEMKSKKEMMRVLKTSEDTFYWTFILLYSCQNKKTQEGRGMKDIELRYVGGHVEVYTVAGAFLFSADTLREAMEELDAA